MALGKIGKYEKLDVLGHGASGIVYLAWDTMLGKHVALKVISIPASDESRYLEEARVLDRLRHPNIVQVNNVDRIDGQLVIDMEYIKGTNLLQHMKQKPVLDAGEAISIAMQVCDALDFAHANYTIHRDIKPANILINEQGNVKIVDFGLAEILGSGSYAGGAGTYAYMSPEDFEEEEKSDHRSDIWAIGVTLYEMLTGNRPFQAAKSKDPFAWKRAVEEDEPESVLKINPALPVKIKQVLSKSLAKDKYYRYQTAGEMRDDLAEILNEMGISKPVIHIQAERKIDLAPDEYPTEYADSRFRSISSDIDIIDFGSIRYNEPSKRKFSVNANGRGRCAGRVVSKPDWLMISPMIFSRRKQTFMLKAFADKASEPGIFDGTLIIEINNEKTIVHLSVEILAERPKFYQIAWWYVPLLVLCMLSPALHHGGWLNSDPGISLADITALSLLSIMLYIITIFAELRSWERLIPALIGAISLGTVVGIIWHEMVYGTKIIKPSDTAPTAITGAIISFLIVLQLITATKWKTWAWILAIISISTAMLLVN